MLKTLLTAAMTLPFALACLQESSLHKRSTEASTPWTYETSINWGHLSPSYNTCRTGTKQSPIRLSVSHGLCHKHVPTFTNYQHINGTFKTWGFGPAFSLSTDDLSKNPKLAWDDETAYLVGWHVHAPSDHLIDGRRAKAEIHLVHADASGHESAVVSVLLDAGTTSSPFFSSLPPYISVNSTASEFQKQGVVDLELLLKDVGMLDEFWSYEGSLTTPPCREGIRWFVARKTVLLGTGQMQKILEASMFSARAEQEVWLHGINE